MGEWYKGCVCLGACLPGAGCHSGGVGVYIPPPQMATAMVGTHPTGMHTCFLNLRIFCIVIDTLEKTRLTIRITLPYSLYMYFLNLQRNETMIIMGIEMFVTGGWLKDFL